MDPVRIRRISTGPGEFDIGKAVKAITHVKEVLKYLTIAKPLIHYTPHGEGEVNIPLIYNGYGLDRIHFDPYNMVFSPKGRPVHFYGLKIDPEEIYRVAKKYFSEVVVIEAAEYRDPENAWIIPLAWRNLIIAHVKVDYNGEELIPDPGLTGELSRIV